MFFTKKYRTKLKEILRYTKNTLNLLQENRLSKTSYKEKIDIYLRRIDNIDRYNFENFNLLKLLHTNQIFILYDIIRNQKKNLSNLNLHSSSNLALDSNDCKFPESTLDGALFKPNFINKIKELYADASLLDIGCGGGGIVYNALFSGITAYGIDGSDYNKKRGLGYWAVDEGNLLTCDATKPFYFTNDNGDIHHFKIISSYECLEHIPEHSVNKFLLNVYNNLSSDGFFIGSISKMPYFNEKTGVIYHVTLKDNEWWKKQFQHAKLTMIDIDKSPFSLENFSRGIGYDYQDMHTNYIENPQDGILFIAKKD